MTKKAHKNITEPPIYVEDLKGKLHKYSVKICASGQREVQGRFGDKVLKFRAESREELENWIINQWEEADKLNGNGITYFNAVQQYISQRPALAETTKNTYRRVSSAYFKCLHDVPLNQLTKAKILEAVNDELTRGVSRKTLKIALALLSAVCHEFEVVTYTKKVQADINRYAQHSASRGRKALIDWESAPSACEVAKWASECDTTTAISILLDLHSLRSEETRGLRFSDVYKQDGKCYIDIVRTRSVINGCDFYRKNTKTDASQRKILIDRRLFDLIHDQPHSSESAFIIDRSYSVYRNRIKRVMSDHGVSWATPHDLRHIFKSEHIGNPIANAVGGWVSRGSTAEVIYSHVKQRDMDELMMRYSASLLDAFEHKEAPLITVIACTA